MLRFRAQELRDADEPMFSVRFHRGDEDVELLPRDVASLPEVGVLQSWFHWSRGTPVAPHRDACTW